MVAEFCVKYGLIPELVGRMPVITTLHPLDADALVRILTEPKNAILKQYVQLFELDGVKLEFTDDALRAVAQLTLKRETGARGLRSVMEGVLTKLMFDVPSDPTVERIVITAACVNENAQPEIVYNPDKKGSRGKTAIRMKNAARRKAAGM